MRIPLLALSLSACGAAAEKPAAEKPAAEKPAAAPASPPAPATPPARSPSHATAEECAHPCVLLQQYPFEYVQQNYCTLCGPHDAYACEFDWPTNDVPTCDLWDYYRNCIYASYGYTFQKPEWAARFKQTDWYRPDPAFNEAKMSDTARANIEFLKKARAEQWSCAG